MFSRADGVCDRLGRDPRKNNLFFILSTKCDPIMTTIKKMRLFVLLYLEMVNFPPLALNKHSKQSQCSLTEGQVFRLRLKIDTSKARKCLFFQPTSTFLSTLQHKFKHSPFLHFNQLFNSLSFLIHALISPFILEITCPYVPVFVILHLRDGGLASPGCRCLLHVFFTLVLQQLRP